MYAHGELLLSHTEFYRANCNCLVCHRTVPEEGVFLAILDNDTLRSVSGSSYDKIVIRIEACIFRKYHILAAVHT